MTILLYQPGGACVSVNIKLLSVYTETFKVKLLIMKDKINGTVLTRYFISLNHENVVFLLLLNKCILIYWLIGFIYFF